MNKTRRNLITALALSPMAAHVAGVAHAQMTEYNTLPNALPVENPGKIEVAEFFWYGCIHCYNLESALEGWIRKLPPDVYFRRIPAVFNERWGHDGAIYYAFESLGLLGKLHRPFFDAIHKDRLKTDDPAALSEWLTRNGVDPKKMDTAMKSFGVQSKLKSAIRLTSASMIDGTPALMVQGRYTISTEQGRSREGMLANADRLIPQIRKTLGGAK
jgi:thiol:disulfide interchange protein DsbA